MIENKFTLCCLPTQYGKTFVATRRVISDLDRDIELGKSLHIVVTMNNLLNTAQTALRFDKALAFESSVAVLSSKRMKKPFIGVSKIAELKKRSVVNGNPSVLVTCNNKFRLNQILGFVEELQGEEENKSENSVCRVFLYFDELHKYIDSSRAVIEKLATFNVVKEIIALSATPYAIWSNKTTSPWFSLKIMNHPDTELSSNYIGIRHTDFQPVSYTDIASDESNESDKSSESIESSDLTPIDFIRHTLECYPEILASGAFVFIPADVTCYSHIFVRKMLFEICPQVVIVLLNGTEKVVSFIKGTLGTMTTIPLPNSLEISDGICKVLDDHRLDRERPIIVTGFLCLGMGQTLTNNTLGPFSSAILGKTDLNNDDIYQVLGRVTGRIDEKKKTKVYTTEESMTTALIMESMTENLLVNFSGLTCTQEEYLQPMMAEDISMVENMKRIKLDIMKREKDPNDKGSSEFDTQEEAISFAKIHFERPINFKKRKTNKANKLFQKYGENLPVEQLLKRFAGCTEKHPVQMIPTDKGTWLIYWRPSIIGLNESEEKIEYSKVYEDKEPLFFSDSNPIKI